jgi:hypothetical protein
LQRFASRNFPDEHPDGKHQARKQPAGDPQGGCGNAPFPQPAPRPGARTPDDPPATIIATVAERCWPAPAPIMPRRPRMRGCRG